MSGSSTHILTAGDLQAMFWPEAGILGASLRLGGVELLRRVDDLDAARVKGSTAGIPLLYPWANRLGIVFPDLAGRRWELHGVCAAMNRFASISNKSYVRTESGLQ
jgi:hypothetical protein